MNDVYYLVHVTKNYSEEWSELKPSSLNDYKDQYPGVYFSIVTKKNINKIQLFPGKQILLFSKKLLEQKNYHINIKDYNGIISEKNTYYPWNLNEALKKIGDSNEIIFHDPIPMKYLCVAILKSNISYDIELTNKKLLPRVSLYSKEPPNTEILPFLCYPLENNYTGINPLPKSSRRFFIKMAKLCGIDPKLKTSEIINKIEKKIPTLYKNRSKQHLEYLMNKNIHKKK